MRPFMTKVICSQDKCKFSHQQTFYDPIYYVCSLDEISFGATRIEQNGEVLCNMFERNEED